MPITVKEQRLSGHQRLEAIFAACNTDEEQVTAMRRIRFAAHAFAVVLHENTPRCAARVLAVQRIDEAVMIANAAIARKGVVYR